MDSRDYYNAISKGYEKLHSEEQQAKAKIIVEEIKLNNYSKLLDVGCGSGISMQPFKCKKIGVDNSEELLKLNPYPTIKAEAENLPFDNDRFDIVICITALHNFNNPKKALQEMIRVCKNRVVISLLKKTPRFKNLKRLISESFKIDKIIDESKDKIFFLSLK